MQASFISSEQLLQRELHSIVEDFGLKPVLEGLAEFVSAERVTLMPSQVETIRNFLELAAEEIR
ncbi:MAG: hypothetical protein F6J97_08215 [Leptolyngbya sp. SIO4C1]|nr:hypothetical protein [Leptolyngbya sp. SIO4C1]